MPSPADPPDRFDADLDAAVAAVTAGAAAIRDIYDRDSAVTYTKADGSPVTDADLAADRAIRDLLAARFPADAILTEEGADDPARLAADRCWVVDPLDGTAEFVARSGDFDVLVALVVGGRPVVAAGCHPPSGLVVAAALGAGAWTSTLADPARRPFRLVPVPENAPPRLLTATWFGGPGNLPALGRAAERLGAVPPVVRTTGFSPRLFIGSERDADAMLGLRAAPDTEQAMGWEWDFVVSDLIVHEAGGVVTDLRGHPHRYNKPVTRNLGGLIVAADPATHALLLAALEPELPDEDETARR